MAWKKSHLTLALLLVGELAFTATLPTPLWAQPVSVTPSTTIPRRSVVRVTFEPPGDGTPSDTAGGASRDGGICPEDSQAISPPITPLKPAHHSGLTVANRPTFFIYVPQTAAQKAVFVLKDKNEDYFYEKTISIPRTAGVVSFKLPDDAPAIETGKTYQWSFVMMCGQAIRPDSPAAEGQIQRIEPKPELLGQLKNLSPLERAAVYGKNGLWYDTLASLAEQMRSQPNNSTLISTWEKLLQSVGLEAIATKPLLQ